MQYMFTGSRGLLIMQARRTRADAADTMAIRGVISVRRYDTTLSQVNAYRLLLY